MLNTYYDQLEALRAHLTEHGHELAALRLAEAERSGSTSGEVINNVGLVLRDLIAGSTDSTLSAEMNAALEEGQRLWDLSNR